MRNVRHHWAILMKSMGRVGAQHEHAPRSTDPILGSGRNGTMHPICTRCLIDASRLISVAPGRPSAAINSAALWVFEKGPPSSTCPRPAQDGNADS